MLYWIGKVMLWPVLAAVFRPWVRGLDNIPASGPAILASNHLSVSDSFFLPVVCPRRVSFLAKSEYFTGRGVKGRAKAMFFRGVGQVPVDRSGGAAAESAIGALASVLARGELVGIYPEGTRSPDGRLYRGRTGVARLALRTGAPVIPVAMIGTDVVQPIGTSLPRVHRVGVVVGEPLDFSRYAGMDNDRFVLRSVTDEIVYELMRLSGQEYADMYATTMKDRLGSAPVKARLAAATRGAVGGELGVAAARAAAASPAAVAPADGSPAEGTVRSPGADQEETGAADVPTTGATGTHDSGGAPGRDRDQAPGTLAS